MEAGKAALKGFADGFSDGFMWGGITAGATTVGLAAKGKYINKIGKLKPANKKGNGYMGVRYGTKRSSGKIAYKSIELHSPHKGGPHQKWHWQRNSWSYKNKKWTISARARRWNIRGKRI